MAQRDVMLRWIEELAKVVARLLLGPGAVDVELAESQVRAAISQHLGPMALLLPQLDVRSGAGLLHEADRIFGYAQLLGLLAAVQHAAASPDASTTHARAVGFGREALARDPNAPAAWHEWVTDSERWPPAPIGSAASEPT
jgi:hypothetical protein